jgi:hypothetical protein
VIIKLQNGALKVEISRLTYRKLPVIDDNLQLAQVQIQSALGAI